MRSTVLPCLQGLRDTLNERKREELGELRLDNWIEAREEAEGKRYSS
jgi:hypothetical protein